MYKPVFKSAIRPIFRPLFGSANANIITSPITASDWSPFGTNTATDNGDGSVKISYVDNAAGAQLDFGALFPEMEADTTTTWDIEYRAKVNTGNLNVALDNETPPYALNISNTTYVTRVASANYDGTGTFGFSFGAMGLGEEVDIEFLSIRRA